MDGSLIVNKPEGLTSHDVVARVRRIVKTRRVGHAGTLDPFATGVLVICIGRATRLVQFLTHLNKEYIATIRFGFATDTQDLTGKQITPFKSSNELSLERVLKVLAEFKGPQLQKPPMYSAKKVAGERLYRAAREGREVERSSAMINVYLIEPAEPSAPLLKVNADGTRDFDVRVRCSSGTYIRTLAHDIGERVETGAHLAALQRTKVGGFAINRAVRLDELEQMAQEGAIERALVSPADTIGHLTEVRLAKREVEHISNGRAVQLPEGVRAHEGDMMRLCRETGELIAVAEYDADGQVLKPRVVMSA